MNKEFTTNRPSLKEISKRYTPGKRKMNQKERSEIQQKMMRKDYHGGQIEAIIE